MSPLRRKPRTLAFLVMSTFFTLRACSSCVNVSDVSPDLFQSESVASASVNPGATIGYDDSAPRGADLTDPGARLYVYERGLAGPHNPNSPEGRATASGAVGDIGHVGDLGRARLLSSDQSLFGASFLPGTSPLSRMPVAAHGESAGRSKSVAAATAAPGDHYGECTGNKWVAHCGVGGCTFTNCQR